MKRPITNPTTWNSLSGSQPGSLLDTQFNLAFNALNDASTFSNYLVDVGAANAYIVNLPAGWTFTLEAGVRLQILAANANTTAATLNAFGSGAIGIVRKDGSAIQAGDIAASGIADVQYDGTHWQLLNYQQSFVLNTAIVRASTSKNNGSSPTIQWDMSASALVLRKPSDGTSLTIQAPATKTVDITVSNAPGGRDQTAALSASSWAYFYWIAKADGTLNGVVSPNAPSTGPNLGGGAFAGYVLWGLDSVGRVDGSVHLLNSYMRGHYANYQLKNVLGSSLSSGSETALTTTLNTLIPPIALEYKISGRMTVSGTGTSCAADFNLYVATGVIYSTPGNASAISFGGGNTSAGCGISEILPATGYLAYRHTAVTANVNTDLAVPWFTIDNGG